MKVHIILKDTSSFILEGVEAIGIVKHQYEGKYRRIIWFRDVVHGVLAYPLTNIAEMITETISTDLPWEE